MFNMTNKFKPAYLSKILMGFGLASYLVLFLAGDILHNHPILILPHFQYVHEEGHLHQDCSHHGKSDKHSDDQHNCPVCQFQAVVVGALLVVSITLFFTLLVTFQVFSENQNQHSLQKYFSIYLRAPPVLAA